MMVAMAKMNVNLSDSCTYCRSRTPNICAENKFMYVSEGSCIRIMWLSDKKWNCKKSFEYKTSFCRPPPATPLPFNSPAQIELASKISSYATVEVTAPWVRMRHLSVQMHFCPLKLLCNLDHFLCNDGSCTPYTDVCNGRWDCKNGDEEEAFC